MSQISQKPVSAKVLKRITNQFFDSISRQKRFNLKPFLINLLTETEQIMLAKRLATIFMLIDNVSYYKIRKILKISSSTSKRLHKNLLNGEYKDMEKWFKKEKNKEAFWLEIETIINVGLPSIGKNRWKFLDDIAPK